MDYEGNSFANTSDVEKDLLSITSVHPMREDAVSNFLSKVRVDCNIVVKLLEENKIIEIEYNSKKFCLRKFCYYPGAK